MIGTLLTLLIILAIVGLILWGLGQVPGIPAIVKTIIYVIVGCSPAAMAFAGRGRWVPSPELIAAL